MKKICLFLLIAAMLLPTCITAMAEESEILIPIPNPIEGKSFYEQVDPNREIYVSSKGSSVIIIYMNPLEVVPGYNLREGYTSYSKGNGYFPEVYNYLYDYIPNDVDHVQSVREQIQTVDITWLDGSENLKNKRAGTGVFCPMYKIIYDSAEYTVEEAMDLFDGRKDVYFIEPAYADNIELYAHSYLSHMAAPPSWYWSYVIYAVKNGIMNGFTANYDPYSDGAYHESFRPNDVLTRAQLAQILYNIYGNGEKPQEKPGYAYIDMIHNAWYYDAMCWAIDKGILNGVSLDKMEPDTPVTREMFVTMLYRAADTLGLSTVNSITEDISGIADLDTVAEWATEAAKWAAEGGLMSGTKIGDDMMWLPQDTCTRAQAAKVFTLFHNYHSAYAPESGMTEEQFYDMLHNR